MNSKPNRQHDSTMPRPINEYGDKFRPTEGGHGVDIASQRQDELDRESLEYIRARSEAGREVTAVDLGGGSGAHAIRMAQSGAQVVMIDLAGTAAEPFARACAELGIPAQRLALLQKDFAALSPQDLPADFDVLYSQRAIHYLPYRNAQTLLGRLLSRMAAGGAAYISAAGYDTEYGKTYPGCGLPVEDRFHHVTPEMQAKHGIERKLVTYQQEDLRALLRFAGFVDVRVWTSAFGNIKATARKPL